MEPVYPDFAVLYRRFYKKAFLFTRSYVHDEMVAEDIASESLIKLWETLRREEVRSPDTYLLALLKNKSLDYLRHEAVKENAFTALESVYREELNLRISFLEACNPEAIFTAEIQQIIRDTLARFPEQTRRVFEMSRFENKSNKEIAQAFGLTVKSIEYHLTKVLKTLRISLKDYLPLF